MLFNVRQFFQVDYLFARLPAILDKRFLVIWVAVGVVFIVAGVIVKILPRRRGISLPLVRWWRRIGTAATTSGGLLLFLLFFRYERVPLFSARFWLIVWGLGVVLWTASLIATLRRKIPIELKDAERREKANSAGEARIWRVNTSSHAGTKC